MKNSLNTQYRWHAIKVIQQRSSQSKLWGMGIFTSMSAGFLFSTVMLINSIRYVENNLLLIEQQPLLIPILANSIIISLFLSMMASISASRELDLGTLEALLYGPVDESAYIIGTFIAHMKIFFFLMVGAFIWANLCAWILNLSFKFNILGLMMTCLMMSFELVAFGLFSAIVGGKTRKALIYFILIVLFLGGIQTSDFIVSGLIQLQSTTVSDPVIVIRNILQLLNSIIRWISPFSLALNGMQSVVNQRMGEFSIYNALMFLEGSILIAISIFFLKKKGVRGIK